MRPAGPGTLAVTDGMAVVTTANPPVNALSAAVRAGLLDAARRAADPGAAGVVIAAKGKTLIAGADITELGKPPVPPSLPEVIDAFDRSHPMTNEGARILDEGIAAHSGDIDVVWLSGYGWAAWRGGPMFHSDQVGLPRIVARLEEFAARTGEESLRTASLLLRLAREGRGFASLAREAQA